MCRRTAGRFCCSTAATARGTSRSRLILFLLYADAVHAVVTLDGYNERYFVGASVRFEFPANNFMDVNPLRERRLLVRREAVDRSESCTGTRACQPVALAVGGGVPRPGQNRRVAQGQQELYIGARARRTSTRSSQLPTDWDEERRVAWADRQYRKYIRAMDAIAAQNGVLVAHFHPAGAGDREAADGRGEGGGRRSELPGALSSGSRSDVLSLANEGTPIFSLLDLFEHNTQYAVRRRHSLAAGAGRGQRGLSVDGASGWRRCWREPGSCGRRGRHRLARRSDEQPRA